MEREKLHSFFLEHHEKFFQGSRTTSFDRLAKYFNEKTHI